MGNVDSVVVYAGGVGHVNGRGVGGEVWVVSIFMGVDWGCGGVVFGVVATVVIVKMVFDCVVDVLDF